MAGVRIKRLEFNSPQPEDTDFEVTVVANNRNTVVTFWDSERCQPSGALGESTQNNGHRARAKVVVSDQNGVVKETDWRPFCAPIDTLNGEDPKIPFTFNLRTPGTYSVKAIIADDIGGGHRFTKVKSLRVIAPGEADEGDTGGGGNDNGGNNDLDNPDSGGDILSWVLNNQQKAAGILLLLAFLAVASPYASIAANATGNS